MNKDKTPQQGLIILEDLYAKYPENFLVKQNLIDAYIKLGHHDKAIHLINTIDSKKTDIQTLKWRAWVEHEKHNIIQERAIWDIITSTNYLAQIHQNINNLILKSTEYPTIQKNDIPLLCVQRNEIIRLPYFLSHYRNLGVTKFIFIDNNSNDGSLEFLLQQSDCYIFWTDDGFNQAVYGLTWLNYLINEANILQPNQWYLIADVDEFLVYPDCEKRKLPTLINYLDNEGSEAVVSFMLDMYADNLLGHNDNNFINEHIYFYNNHQIFYQAESPYLKISGGIRNHLFSEYNDYHVKTALFKKLNQKSYLLASTHQTTPYKISKITTAFKHYKFVNLKEIAEQEIQRKQHSGGGSRYRHYHNYFNNYQAFNYLTSTKTTQYQNSRQLVDLGLIQSTDKWDNFWTISHTHAYPKSYKHGLEMLEKLYHYNTNNEFIMGSLINAYIKFGYHKEAISLINTIPKQKTNSQILKWRAWVEHKNGNIENEKQLWQEILSKTINAGINNKIKNFIRCSTQNISIETKDIVLICVIHNEMLRLPFFLKYYRNLGITQFFFVDNNSDDGSLEFLLQQPDSHVFWTDDSHSTSGSGIYWVHHLMDNYIPKNQWCIHADADEFLVYPHFENNKLPILVQYLDRYNYDAVGSFMLDMFPKDINQQLNITPDDDLLALSPYFYNNYSIFYQETSPYINPTGGIFYYYDIYFRRAKISLFKNKESFRFLSSAHSSTPTRIADVSSAYFHLKMIGDFYQKALDEQVRKEHAGGGLAYTQYAKMYQCFNDKNFDFTTLAKTTKYNNSNQLVDLGLIKTSTQWEYFTQKQTPKTPSEGLVILENLYKKHPNHDIIKNSLIDIYIKLNKTSEAKTLIERKPLNRHNLQSLKYHAYLAHQENNIDKELDCWLRIAEKKLQFLPNDDRDYFLSQAITKEQKISLCQENFDTLFNYAYYSMPAKLQVLLGNQIRNIILIANNREITLEHLESQIKDNDLIVCFNFSVFMNFYQHFPHNPKLFFFRKMDSANHYFFGLPKSSISNRSSIDINFDNLYDVISQSSTYLLFNEHLPHTLDLPTDIYQKIYNPEFSGLLSQFHQIFDCLEPTNYYFRPTTLPSSGFMALKYFYYARLHLLNMGRSGFNIKLIGFNFTNNSFYLMHGHHNWIYERSQLDKLPNSIECIGIP